jgi:hypothetical protein
MSLRSMRKAARFAASNLHSSRTQRSRLGIESGSDRGPSSSCRRESEIIMVSRYAERLLVAQRISTGSGVDCESPFFLDDSDVSATEFATDFAVPSVVRGRPAEVSILRLGGRRIDHEQAN